MSDSSKCQCMVFWIVYDFSYSCNISDGSKERNIKNNTVERYFESSFPIVELESKSFRRWITFESIILVAARKLCWNTFFVNGKINHSCYLSLHMHLPLQLFGIELSSNLHINHKKWPWMQHWSNERDICVVYRVIWLLKFTSTLCDCVFILIYFPLLNSRGFMAWSMFFISIWISWW